MQLDLQKGPIKTSSQQIKDHPHPQQKRFIYGMTGGVRMPQKSEFVCHKSRFVHHVLCESPFIFSDSFETPGRTLWAFLGTCPGVLFQDSFRTLPGFRARRAREILCGAGPIARSELFSDHSDTKHVSQVVSTTRYRWWPSRCNDQLQQMQESKEQHIRN